MSRRNPTVPTLRAAGVFPSGRPLLCVFSTVNKPLAASLGLIVEYQAILLHLIEFEWFLLFLYTSFLDALRDMLIRGCGIVKSLPQLHYPIKMDQQNPILNFTHG